MYRLKLTRRSNLITGRDLTCRGGTRPQVRARWESHCVFHINARFLATFSPKAGVFWVFWAEKSGQIMLNWQHEGGRGGSTGRFGGPREAEAAEIDGFLAKVLPTGDGRPFFGHSSVDFGDNSVRLWSDFGCFRS